VRATTGGGSTGCAAGSFSTAGGVGGRVRAALGIGGGIVPGFVSAGSSGISRVMRRGRIVTSSRCVSLAGGGSVAAAPASSPDASARSRPSEPIIRRPDSSRPGISMRSRARAR
jgi:hypothetical protein